MATTGYETLQQAVADAQANLSKEKALLSSLQTDASYLYYMSRLNDPRVNGNGNAWISAGGEYWEGSDAKANRDIAVDFVNKHNVKLATQQQVVTTAESTLASAKASLIDYEKNSPVGKAAAGNSNTIKVVAIIGIVLVVATMVVLSIRYFRKNKKEAPKS